MSNQNQATYPPPATAYPAEAQGSQMDPPAPAGYPVKDGQQGEAVPVTTQTRGDGFWKGCCAALCCCCVLDACF